MKLRIACSSILFLSALALGACSGGDDGGSSGVDSSKTLDEVTLDDAVAFCEWSEDLVDPASEKKLGCIFTGLFTGQGDEAAYHYNRFIELWQDCEDPLCDRVEEARDSVAGITD